MRSLMVVARKGLDLMRGKSSRIIRETCKDYTTGVESGQILSP